MRQALGPAGVDVQLPLRDAMTNVRFGPKTDTQVPETATPGRMTAFDLKRTLGKFVIMNVHDEMFGLSADPCYKAEQMSS